MKTEAAKIYVVDDSRTVLRHSQFVLESAGYRVKTFADGRTILEVIRKDPPDLLILDYILPGQNGLKLAVSIKKEFPALPVVILTGHGSEEVAAEALRAGADDYIIKPFLPEIMTHVVQRVLEKSRQQKKNSDLARLQATLAAMGAAVHEMSQPLTAIYGEAQIALADLSPEDPRYASFKLIETQCAQLTRAVDRLRSLTLRGPAENWEDAGLLELGKAGAENRN